MEIILRQLYTSLCNRDVWIFALLGHNELTKQQPNISIISSNRLQISLVLGGRDRTKGETGQKRGVL